MKQTSEELAKSDTMALALVNVGGLLGQRHYKFQQGLNVLLTRNTLGATSTIKALAFAIGSPDVEGGIHQLAKSASSSIKIGSKSWSCELISSEQGVKVGARTPMLENPYRTYAVVVNEKHPLSNLTDGALREFLTTIAGADKFREEARKLEQTIAEIRETTREAKEKKIEMEPLHEKYARLIQRRLDTDLELQGIVEDLRAQPVKSEEDKTKVAREVEAALADLEARFNEVTRARDSYQLQVDSAKSALDKKLVEKEEDADLVKLYKAREKKKELAPQSLVAGRGRMLFSSYLTMLREWMKHRETGKLKADEREYMECPFCSKFKHIKCQLATVPIKTRIEVFDEVLHEHRVKHKETKGEIEVAGQQVHVLEAKEVETEKQIKILRETLQRASAGLEEAKTNLANLSGERVKLQRNLMKIVGSFATQKKHAEVQVKLSDLDADLDRAKVDNDKYTAIANELAEYEKRLDKKKEEHEAAKKKFEEVLNAARIKFNEEATKVMKEVGFKRFTQIQIDEQFKARITRIVDSREFQEGLDQLSTSEATTLTILLALAAKQAYCPEIPIFAVDTLTTSLDKGKFPRVIEYAKTKVPFVIATMLSSKSQEEIQVIHTVPD